METFNFSVPQDITVGKGSLSKLPEIAKKLGGKHALIISGPHLEKMGLVKKAADYLASVDIKADTFTDIEQIHLSQQWRKPQQNTWSRAQTLSWHSEAAHRWMWQKQWV